MMYIYNEHCRVKLFGNKETATMEGSQGGRSEEERQ